MLSIRINGPDGVLPDIEAGHEGLGKLLDGRHLVIHVKVKLLVLEGIVDILVDVVVKDVLVDTHEDDELTHRSNETAVTVKVEFG